MTKFVSVFLASIGSDSQQSKLDECHACIDDKSCVADVASCSGSCSAFVP